jgi:hypothetical protein
MANTTVTPAAATLNVVAQPVGEVEKYWDWSRQHTWAPGAWAPRTWSGGAFTRGTWH